MTFSFDFFSIVVIYFCNGVFMEKEFDVLIVGGGVAGMSAALYANRSGKNVAIIEKTALGGTVATLNKIENFPSQQSVDGFSLANMFAKQVENLGVEIVYDDAVSADLNGKMKHITGRLGQYKAQSVVLATGLAYNELGKNENAFLGRGVSFCAVCDANFFKGRDVCVISRGGSGIKDAKYLSGVVSKVLVLDENDMTVFAQANKVENMSVLSKVSVKKVLGEETVTGIECFVDGKKQIIKTDAVFVCLGKKPKVDIFGKGLALDVLGFVKTDENMQTSIKGVYAAGDIRSGVMKQIVTACSDGAIAGKKACEKV